MPASRSKPGSVKSNNALLKVVILGDGGVGKTCLISRFVRNKFDACSFNTIGVEFINKDVDIDGTTYTLQIWDTAGQERFKSLRTPFYRGSDICMLTFGVEDRKSFDNLEDWREEFLKYASVDDGNNFPFMVMGNKMDVSPEMRQVTYEEAEEWCQENGAMPYVETSAKDATNVEKAFTIAVESWLKMEESLDKPFFGETVKLDRISQSSHTCCLFQ